MNNHDDNSGDTGGKENDDNEQTNPGNNAEVRAISTAADAIRGAALAVEEGLRLVQKVPGDHRGAVLEKCAILLGELGDLCHEQRRAIIRGRRFKLF